MKHLFNALPKLAVIAGIALSISSCNRAEYAMLPKTTPYHATYGSVKSAPASAQTSEKAVAAEIPVAKQTEEEVAVATTPTPAPAVAAVPVATAPAAVTRTTRSATATPQASLKPTFTQRLALNKVSKKLDKLTSKVQIKQHSDAAKANALSGNLRTGIILLLIGLLVSLFSGISGIFGLIGGIIAIIGVIFIVLWLLDEL